jgi:hypothetical protein
MSLPRRPEVQALVHIRPVVEEFAPSFVPGPGYGLLCSVLTSRARGTTKCPESLCLSLALPPSGRRVPPPPRTLLLSLRSYRLMRQSRVALPYFGFWPRSWSLCRLLPAPAATGIIPTLSLRILPQMPGPVPRQVPQSAFTCFFLCVIGLPRVGIGSASRFFPRTRLFADMFFEAADISLCSGLRVCAPPRSFPPLCPSHRAAEAFTFGLNVLRCLRTHRIC